MSWPIWIGVGLGYAFICFLAWSLLAVSARADRQAALDNLAWMQNVIDKAKLTDERDAALIREAIERQGKG